MIDMGLCVCVAAWLDAWCFFNVCWLLTLFRMKVMVVWSLGCLTSLGTNQIGQTDGSNGTNEWPKSEHLLQLDHTKTDFCFDFD